MSKPVRFGVIGAGGMGCATMLDLMAGHPAAAAVAYYEIDPHRADMAERIPRLAKAGIHQCGSMEELLARQDVDIILNCTPHYAHAEVSIAAMKAGHAVLCEKPPACTLSQCQAMIDAARLAGRLLMIHFQHMLRPSAVWLKQAICRGDLGRIRRVKCLSLWWRADAYYTRVAWSGKRFFNGQPAMDGVMSNQTVHFINQALAMAQRTGPSHIARPKNLRSALYRFHSPSVLEMEDTAVVTGTLDNDDQTELFFAGTTCADEAHITDRTKGYGGTPAKHHVITIEGDRGQATWDGAAQIEINGQPVETFDKPDGPWPFYFHLQNVLAGKEEPITPAEQSVNTMRFIFAAHDACQNQIAARDWSVHADVAATLRQCCQDFHLPAELKNPPAWA